MCAPIFRSGFRKASASGPPMAGADTGSITATARPIATTGLSAGCCSVKSRSNWRLGAKSSTRHRRSRSALPIRFTRSPLRASTSAPSTISTTIITCWSRSVPDCKTLQQRTSFPGMSPIRSPEPARSWAATGPDFYRCINSGAPLRGWLLIPFAAGASTVQATGCPISSTFTARMRSL